MPKKSSKKKATKSQEMDFEVISVAPLRAIKEAIKEDVGGIDIKHGFEELARQVEKVAVTNLTLQAKLTDLLTRIVDLIQRVDDMVLLLKKASETETEPPVIRADISPVTDELKMLNKRFQDLKENIDTLIEYMRKSYTRNLIGRVVEKG
jgi:predicted transcriptional regulator